MPSSLFDLSGRVALITGASRRIGRAIARGCGEAGAVLATAHVPENAEHKFRDPYGIVFDISAHGRDWAQR
jgi:NAD(P)-dependent dehydrogenase (short-subunit alcohol dehydrogenase family)